MSTPLRLLMSTPLRVSVMALCVAILVFQFWLPSTMDFIIYKPSNLPSHNKSNIVLAEHLVRHNAFHVR